MGNHRMSKISVGDRVRDKAHLGGVIMTSMRDRCFVQRNNGERSWIATNFLAKETSMSINYHGEIFDNGRRFLTIEGETGAAIVTLKIEVGPTSHEIVLEASRAIEIARHLRAAAEAAQR
jgi:hypothetical protein